jgi:SAM-dependent methyltransferase
MNELRSKKFWTEAWRRHIDGYLRARPRCGYWIETFFSKSLTFLEIASGSCRDSLYLAQRGFNILACDFELEALKLVNDRFFNSNLPLFSANAFCLPFMDRSFDVTFSNGFWICYSDDRDLYSLIREQVRITRRYVVSFVHNGENQGLVAHFRSLSSYDSLYNIRFFKRREVLDIVSSSGILYKNVYFRKFGGKMDCLYSGVVNNVPNPLSSFAQLLVPRLYNFQPWEETERIVCIIELY